MISADNFSIEPIPVAVRSKT